MIGQPPAWMIDRSSETGYWTVVVTRNGERTIGPTLESVLAQTLRPRLVCVVDDGSTDATPEILDDLVARFTGEVAVIRLPDRGYDVRRVVMNINLALKNAEHLGVQARYFMVSGDDCIYPVKYAGYIVERMDADSRIVVASGDVVGCGHPDVTPRGSGRFVRISFLQEVGGCFPVFYGYEAWILKKALQLGYRVQNFADVRFEHCRDFGVDHGFRDWGPAMLCLGYHPLEVLYRCLRYVFLDRRLPVRYLVVSWSFVMSRFSRRGDPYFRYCDADLRRFIRDGQLVRNRQRLARFLSFHRSDGREAA